MKQSTSLFGQVVRGGGRQLALVGIILAIAGLGLVMLHGGRAATNFTSAEPELGSVASPACAKSDSTASGGSYVSFGGCTVTPPPPPTANGSVHVIFYYPWFPQTWGSNLSNPFTNYHPTLGYYSSDDQAIVTKHIAAMRYAHMNVAISSWWGQNQQSENTRLPMQLSLASGTGLSWSLYYEKEGFGNPAVSEISGDLNYIKSRYMTSPNFAVIKGKPAIFVYGDSGDGCAMADRWKQANAAAGNSFNIYLKVFSGYLSCPSQPAGWHQYSPAVAADSQAGICYAIGAGFWKKGTAVTLARDPARWITNVKSMVASNAPLQIVATFNEWGEGTAIESASEWASTSGYGTYLDALHTYVPAN